MAAVGPEVTGSWFLLPGPVSFFIVLLLLSIFLTTLCNDCRRHSFDLHASDVDKNPSTLIRVVKLEEALEVRENPAINEIQSDEVNPESYTTCRRHLEVPQNPEQNHQDVQTNGSAAVMKTTGESEPPPEENVIKFTPWRSHLRAPQSEDSTHIHHIMESKRSSGADVSSHLTNQQPEDSSAQFAKAVAVDTNQMYARVSRKVRPTPPPVHTPEEVQEEEEPSPPLPHRETQMEG